MKWFWFWCLCPTLKKGMSKITSEQDPGMIKRVGDEYCIYIAYKKILEHSKFVQHVLKCKSPHLVWTTPLETVVKLGFMEVPSKPSALSSEMFRPRLTFQTSCHLFCAIWISVNILSGFCCSMFLQQFYSKPQSSSGRALWKSGYMQLEKQHKELIVRLVWRFNNLLSCFLASWPPLCTSLFMCHFLLENDDTLVQGKKVCSRVRNIIHNSIVLLISPVPQIQAVIRFLFHLPLVPFLIHSLFR